MVRTLPNLPPSGGVSYLADWPTAVGAAAGAAGAAGVVQELRPVAVLERQMAGTLPLVVKAPPSPGLHPATACPSRHELALRAALPLRRPSRVTCWARNRPSDIAPPAPPPRGMLAVSKRHVHVRPAGNLRP